MSLASALPGAEPHGLAARRRGRADALRVLARTDLATHARTLRAAPVRTVRDALLRGALTAPAGRRLLAEAVAGPAPPPDPSDLAISRREMRVGGVRRTIGRDGG
ncbi:hypothetical protein [Streptomyces virginiae]|uniref:hypothetical protein n=1 Tax=Streptomyces virginiae TaxID=1961 RepID=UPI0036F6934F